MEEKVRKIRRNRGFTLIEIIVTLAILGILVVSFMSLFTNSMIHIFTFGQKSQALHEAQQQMENDLAQENSGTSTLTITFSNGGPKIDVPGRPITVQRSYKYGNISLTSFIPNRNIIQ